MSSAANIQGSAGVLRGKGVRSYPTRERGLLFACTVTLCLCLSLGMTLSYFTAQDEKTHSTPLAQIELTLAEEWDPTAGVAYHAGITSVKSPTITAEEGAMYARVRVKVEERVLDENGALYTRLITDPVRLALIEGIFYADTQNRLTPGTPYSLQRIRSTVGVLPLYDSTQFFAPTSPRPGLYYFAYIGIIPEGTSATLFNRLVIPADYTEADVALMGNFIITLEGQGIQSFGFASQDDAMEALDRALGEANEASELSEMPETGVSSEASVSGVHSEPGKTEGISEEGDP